MNVKLLPLLLITAALFVPGASAQSESATITGPNEAMLISATAATTLTYSVSIPCSEFISQGDTSLTGTLTTNLPSYYGASSSSVDFAGTSCIGASQTVTQDIVLTLKPTKSAMGLKPTSFTITATVGTATGTFDHTAAIQIEYVNGHTMTTSVGFPYNFTDADNGTLTFQINLTITANAKTMIMFENVGQNGSAAGIGHQTFDVAAGETFRTLNVTYSPPTSVWANDTITFYTYSHCLDGSDCGPTNAQNVTWVINNMSSQGQNEPADEKSPGAPTILLALALLAAAFVARRS